MKNQIYNEMCSFLAGREELLTEFKNFHEKNKNSENYFNLFDAKYGVIYKSFKTNSTTPGAESNSTQHASTSKEDYYNKYISPTKQSFISYINNPTPDPNVEKILKIVALIVLIAGVIGSICLLRTIVSINSSLFFYSRDYTFSLTEFLLSFSPALGGVVCWTVLNVLRNISINVSEIKNKVTNK